MTSSPNTAGPGAAPRSAFWRSPLLALALAALFWSGNFVAGRALNEQIDPLTLNFARWSFALVLFLPFVWHEVRPSMPVVRREWRLILSLGATGIALFQTLVYLALRSTTATNALLVLSLAPIAILAAAAIVGTERPTRRQIAGTFVSLTGAAILIAHGDLAALRALQFNAGDLWMIVAATVWAAYTILLRRRPPDLPQRLTLAASIVAALLVMAPFALVGLTAKLGAVASASVAASIAYIAIFASIGAFLLWSYGVSRIGPTRAGQFIHLMPLFGTILAIVFLGEMPTYAQLGGGALVLCGIFVVEKKT